MTIAFLIGLNALDLVLTAIGLSLGCVEVGWFGWTGMDSLWKIAVCKIATIGLVVWLLYRLNLMRLLKYVNIGLVVLALINTASIVLMTL